MRRYVLIDYNHLAHRCMTAQPLSAVVNIGGALKEINTTIPTYTIKNIYSYSGMTTHYTGVFFEGGSSFRKEHFAKMSEDGYKGQRKRKSNPFYKGIELTTNLLVQGKVSCYRSEGYEADDLIYSAVMKIKSVDKETPIDIITNDSDLLPLVDEQVSVYMRGTRQYEEEGCPARRLCYQVTPRSWDEYLSYTSAYKAYNIPYNSMLLFKLIKGDKADNVPMSVKGYGGKKYTELMEKMKEDGVDFANIFRYGVAFDEVMKPVLDNYFSEEDVARMKYVYEGLNLRYVGVQIPKLIDIGKLQSALLPLKIHLVR